MMPLKKHLPIMHTATHILVFFAQKRLTQELHFVSHPSFAGRTRPSFEDLPRGATSLCVSFNDAAKSKE